MKKVSFLLGIHNHQPIGNFDNVFEEAYQKSYLPFLDVLFHLPKIKWNLHCTGILWEWLEKKHPEYFEKVLTMVKRNQVELLTGGFYEPILPVIPDADKIGQIQKLSRYLSDRFHVTPKGMWCAERIWEPHLPKSIREAGVEYTVLDDTHFLSSGLSKDQLYGYYRVEEQYDFIDIFPISQDLRYTIPFAVPEKSMEIFHQIAEKGRDGQVPAVVMADDGEKFGLWPGTHQSVYHEKWLERFLKLLEKNESWIQTQTFSEYRNRHQSLGRIYLPTASYFEMSEWSLPKESVNEFEEALEHLKHQHQGEKIKRFLKGGIWRNFLTKYPESNSMYKKMLRVSQKVHRTVSWLNEQPKKKETDELLKQADDAMAHVWAGQCNCAYWHGVFGGLYLPILRQAIYRNLIDAENVLDTIETDEFYSKEKSNHHPHIEAVDFDKDGNEEILVETPDQNLYFSPHEGGTIFEWDFKPVSVNVGNVLTRRWESYHKKLKGISDQSGTHQDGSAKSIHDIVHVKEKGLENILNYDWYRRVSLIDHFFHPNTRPEDFHKCQYGEQGDFVLGKYEVQLFEKDSKRKDLASIKLSRNGTVWASEQKREITVEKDVEITSGKNVSEKKKATVVISYRITNQSKEPAENLWFASEFNFSFSVPDKEKDVFFTKLKQWERQDPHLFWKIKIDFSDETDGWVFPLETVSNSEGGYERTFQGIIFAPYWKFSLSGKKTFERTMTVTLEKNLIF